MRSYVLAAILFTLAASSSAGTGSPYNESLKGLAKFWVLVEKVGEDAQRAGLSRDQLQKDVELPLRRAGLPVSERDVRAEAAFLYIRVTSERLQDRDAFAFHIRVSLDQGTLLLRDKSIYAGGSTWDTGLLDVVPTQRFASSVGQAVRQLVDEFIADYLAVNPRAAAGRPTK